MHSSALIAFFGFLAAGSPQYSIQTVAGSSYCGDGQPAVSALLVQPEGVAFDSAGNLYIADAGDHRVRFVTADGVIHTVAGTGTPGFSGDGGPAPQALLNRPYGIALDSAGNLYIADLGNARVRVLSKGIIQTLAGGGSVNPARALAPVSAVQATLNSPRNVAATSNGNVYVSDFGGQQVYSIANGMLTTAAGDGIAGYSGDGGQAALSELNFPAGVAADAAGNLYIADSSNNCVRKVSKGTIQTVDAAPTPVGLTLDISGNPYIAGANYLGAPAYGIADNINANDLTIQAGSVVYSSGNAVMQMSPIGAVNVLAGGRSGLFFGDGGPALSARLNNPQGIAVDAAGNLYIADTGNNRIREVLANGSIDTIAGGQGDLSLPSAVALDASGNLYIADAGNNQVKWRAPGGGYSLFLTQLKNPSALAADSSGNVYVADRGNGRIIEVSSSGIVATIATVTDPIAMAVDAAGNLYVSDNSQNALLKISNGTAKPVWQGKTSAPGGVVVDGHGDIYIGDTQENRVRRIGADGTVTTMAGNGTAGFQGDGGPAASAELIGPAGLAFDPNGNLLVADAGNNRIRKLSTTVQAPPGETGSPISVVNAASGFKGSVAPGEIVTIYGQGFDLQTSTVTFDSQPAKLFFVGASQINALVPDGLTPGVTITVAVTSAGVPVGSAAISVAAAVPGIFTTPNGQAAAQNQDGTANSLSNPVARGSIVVLYATGQGETSNAATLTIGGQQAAILYAGDAPGFQGLMQINARVPGNITSGDQDVSLVIGAASSQRGVRIFVQ